MLIDFLMLVGKVFFIWPRVMLNPIFKPLTIFEEKLLADIASQLENKGRILVEHINSINYVQRDLDDRKIRCYHFKPFRYEWKRNEYFDRTLSEETIARFQISFKNGEVLNGSLKALHGVFCVINFSDRAAKCRDSIDFLVEVKKRKEKKPGKQTTPDTPSN